MYTFMWIEGEKNLNEFCLQRFRSKPRFMETIGHVGPATVYLIYKYDDATEKYREMYLLTMQHPNGTVTEGGLRELQTMDFAEIRRTRGTILKAK
jgi:hypothetical protein